MVAKACKLIVEAEERLNLGELAEAVGMSPSHLRRVFTALTGLTPRAYATAHRTRRVREELGRSNTVASAIYNAGFNSNGRFYADSTPVLGMKPAAFRASGEGMTVLYNTLNAMHATSTDSPTHNPPPGEPGLTDATNFQQRLAAIRHVALDMDGTIYSGGRLFDFTLPFLSMLDSFGIGYTFLTNNSSRSVAEYVEHLQHMGLPADAERIFTSTHATIAWLRRELPEVKRLFALATPGMQGELEAAGYKMTDGSPEDEPDAVVVGFDNTLIYSRLCAAAYWAQQGKPYIASHPDRFCPTDQPTVLVDCGAICAAIEVATGRSPRAVPGKPDPYMLQSLLDRHKIEPSQLVMAGDRLLTDIVMARRAGALAVLVLTGDSTAEEAPAAVEPPDLVLPSLRELGELLRSAREQV